MHSVVENVDRVVPRSAEANSHAGRQRVVDEEVHA